MPSIEIFMPLICIEHVHVYCSFPKNVDVPIAILNFVLAKTIFVLFEKDHVRILFVFNFAFR